MARCKHGDGHVRRRSHPASRACQDQSRYGRHGDGGAHPTGQQFQFEHVWQEFEFQLHDVEFIVHEFEDEFLLEQQLEQQLQELLDVI